jgi:thioredoxin reductase
MEKLYFFMPATEMRRKVVILGSGPAGLTAAIYASRAQLEPLVIDGPQPGGQLTITTDVENYPGFASGIMGPELMNQFRAQAERFGTEIVNVWIDKVDLSKRPFTLYGKESKDSAEVSTIIEAETLIISTGSDVSDAFRHQGDDHSPARRIPRVEDHAGARARARQDRGALEHRGPGNLRF